MRKRKRYIDKQNQAYAAAGESKLTLKVVISVLVIVCALVACIGILHLKKGNALTTESGLTVTGLRGVVDSIDELPSTKTSSHENLGTEENPFLVLEIVPYEEFAEFGYTISGCEPVAVEDMYGSGLITTVTSEGCGTYTSKQAYFFPDEPEGDPSKYDGSVSSDNWETKNIEGYYERVEPGEGTFYFDSDGNLVKASEEDYVSNDTSSDDEEVSDGDEQGSDDEEVSDGNEQESDDEEISDDGQDSDDEDISDGDEQESDDEEISDDEQDSDEEEEESEVKTGPDVIWHTVNSFEADYAGQDFNETVSSAAMPNVGDRVYTTRKSDASDPVNIIYNYYIYTSYDSFLTDTLGLSGEEEADYSVLVKTITPDELNDNPEWVDYANLISISPQSHNSGLIEAYKKYNRIGTEYDDTSYNASDYDTTNGFRTNDISWEVAKKIFYKSAETTDYAGIIIDRRVYDISNGYLSGTTETVNTEVYKCDLANYDYTLQDAGWTYSAGLGSKNNVYKLSVMLTVMDPDLFERLYLSDESEYISGSTDYVGELIDEKGNLLTQSAAGRTTEAEYWSAYAFLPISPDTAKGSEYSYWMGSDVWAAYGFCGNLTENSFTPWVKGRVYTYTGGSSVVQSYTSQYDTVSNSNMTDYTEYLSDDEITNPHPSDAVRYILGDQKTKISGTLNVLDIEPCYEANGITTDKKINIYYTRGDENYSSYNLAWLWDASADGGGADYTLTATGDGSAKATVYVSSTCTSLGFIIHDSNWGKDIDDDQFISVGGWGGYEYNVYITSGTRGYTAEEVGTYTYSDPGWELTANTIRNFIPNLSALAKVEITHMTTAEFVGRTEDLAGNYDLVYLGLQYGAYNTGSTVTLSDGTKLTDMPNWNDDSMDGLIYFHTGDMMYAMDNIKDGTAQDRHVEFLYNASTTNELRFSGNDITSIKEDALLDYLKDGHPVIAEEYLYNQETALIDKNSYIYDFIGQGKSLENSMLLSTTDTDGIYNALAKFQGVTITWKEDCPKVYNGDTGGESNSKVIESTANYLDKNDDGTSEFDFAVKISDLSSSNPYKYNIYIDNNKDAKFTSDELFASGTLPTKGSDGYSTVTHALSKDYIGLIQWKIEVYNVDDPSICAEETGCSAIKNDGDEKEAINVLQIVPDSSFSNEGALNLSSSATGGSDLEQFFRECYNSLQDYVITVDVISASDYEAYFEGDAFKYDYAKDISSDNPSNFTTAAYNNIYAKYNMLLIGFGDTYGRVNISNENGAVDFIKYWVAQGRSILLTHDLTSLNNTLSSDFGYSMNSLMRDVMGMNRYGAVYSALASDSMTYEGGSVSALDEMVAYQKSLGNIYDTDANGNTLSQAQGFTYYAMKRLGYDTDNKNSGSNSSFLFPFRYMITQFGTSTYINSSMTNGFNDANDVTTLVTRVNEGQITQYPYKISETITVATTHAQWFQLDVEDPEVTVWYCLANDGTIADGGKEFDKTGASVTYGVSPNDAANNYYIYSKDNIFYSGVGHSSIDSYEEAKLFINTMVAAYRATSVAPMIKIENDNVETVSQDANEITYKLETTDDDVVKDEDGEDSIRVYFTAEDTNPTATELTLTIYVESVDEDGNPTGDPQYLIDTIYKSDGTPIVGTPEYDEDGNIVSITFEGITRDEEYYLDYPIDELEEYPEIIFELTNDTSTEPGITNLIIDYTPSETDEDIPLFMLN